MSKDESPPTNKGETKADVGDRCKRCHYEAHRDRIASLNLAKRASLLLAQEIQASPLGNVAVNQRAWEDDEDLTKSTVSQTIPRSSKPPILIGGH